MSCGYVIFKFIFLVQMNVFGYCYSDTRNTICLVLGLQFFIIEFPVLIIITQILFFPCSKIALVSLKSYPRVFSVTQIQMLLCLQRWISYWLLLAKTSSLECQTQNSYSRIGPFQSNQLDHIFSLICKHCANSVALLLFHTSRYNIFVNRFLLMSCLAGTAITESVFIPGYHNKEMHSKGHFS